jgi:ribonuclease D
MSYEMITTPPALRKAVTEIAGERTLACDLEADSMHHYREKVCLVQLSVPGRTYILDPLSCPDLTPLAPILADPAVRKVFHGADYDVRSLHRDFGMVLNNLFDTMIACQFLGEKELGLAAQLKKRFGAELDKRFQKADWSRRPLTAEMLDYASQDTSLLIELCRQLEGELRVKGRLAWVEEECALLSQVRMAERGDEPLFLRFKGASRMEPRTLAVLEELLRARDERAQQADLPPFKIVGNDLLREVADKKPRQRDDLAAIGGFPQKLLERHGRWLLAAVARGMALEGEKLPRYPASRRPETDREREGRLKRLKTWREEKGRELGMDTGILANNALLEKVAESPPKSPEELAQLEGLKGWQREIFGTDLIRLFGA